MGTDTIQVVEEEINSYNYKVCEILNNIFMKEQEYKDAALELEGVWTGRARQIYPVWNNERCLNIDCFTKKIRDGLTQLDATVCNRISIDEAYVGEIAPCSVANAKIIANEEARSTRTYRETPRPTPIPGPILQVYYSNMYITNPSRGNSTSSSSEEDVDNHTFTGTVPGANVSTAFLTYEYLANPSRNDDN